ncbi:MAG: hypothetical protein ABIF82_04155 [Planctomycetota bacterium]
MRPVYPVGTTLYKPEKCWNACTIVGRPKEVSVTPPAELGIPPDGPLE